MSDLTAHYQLEKITDSTSFSENSYQFSNRDRDKIDQVLYLGAEGHHHTGGAATSVANPTIAPVLSLATSGGSIPAGTRIWYKYSYVDTAGNETGASPETYIDTPQQVVAPAPPTITRSTTGGTLPPGPYYYVLSAYSGATTTETIANQPAYIQVTTGTQTNTVTLTFPSTPTGAVGFNIYRKKPGSLTYYYVTSVAMNVATPPASWTDTGALADDCARTVPVTNTTNSESSITVGIPGATPTVPVGYTWRIYRTITLSDYTNSLLHWVVEETSEGSGIIVPSYTDLGAGTTTGQPLTQGETVTGSPEKVLLTDAAEARGTLPMGMVSGFPYVVTFTVSGTLSVAQGKTLWACEFPKAQIIGCRAVLGNGSVPAATPVIVDVFKGASSATPTEGTIYTTTANRPTVLVGQTVGSRTTPDTTQLNVGDVLRADVIQAGGGATPTDHDLTISVYMWVFGFDATTSFVGF